MNRKPNILLITTDQQRADHLSVKGLQAIHTPNFDRLTQEGIHFDRAYCPSPICTPTRVSLLTGRYPSSHGAYSIGVTIPVFPRPTLPESLSEAGYHTALFGKSHFVSRIDEERHMAGTAEPPEPDLFRKWRGPYLGFNEFEGSTGHTINTTPAQHYRIFLEDSGMDWEPWFPLGRPDYDHHACGSWNIPPEYHDTKWVTDRTVDFLQRQAEASEPWFCWASYQDPHEPFVCPEPWFSSVDTEKMEIPEGYQDGEFEDRHPIYQACYDKNLKPFNEGYGVPSSYGTPERTARAKAAMQATLGMIAFLDDRLGAILDTLEKTGQTDNTLVVFTSDHGEMHGHHGLWGKGAVAYEDCQRVPLLVWAPGLFPARGTLNTLVNLVDLPITFLSLAGAAIPSGTQGHNLVPVFEGQQDEVCDATLVECRPTQNTLYQQTLITDRYKLVLYNDDEPGELYDLEEDPDQYANRWSDPALRETRELLLLRLARYHMEREGTVVPRRNFG